MCNFSVSTTHNLQGFLPKPFILALCLSYVLVGQVAAVGVSTHSTNGRTKISEMELLLPVSLCDDFSSPECHTVTHELFATNGCYDW